MILRAAILGFTVTFLSLIARPVSAETITCQNEKSQMKLSYLGHGQYDVQVVAIDGQTPQLALDKKVEMLEASPGAVSFSLDAGVSLDFMAGKPVEFGDGWKFTVSKAIISAPSGRDERFSDSIEFTNCARVESVSYELRPCRWIDRIKGNTESCGPGSDYSVMDEAYVIPMGR